MSRPKAPWSDYVRSLPSTMTIAEMGESARANGFPEVSNTAIHSSRNAAGLEYKRVLPRREGVVYKNKPGRKPGSKNAKSYKAKNGKAKEPETAAEAMALIRASKQEALKGPAHSEMEAAMKRIVLRYGTQHIRAFLDRLELE